MNSLSDYKELTAVVYYSKFKVWRDKYPLLNDIPDNELSYVILDGLIKPRNGDTNSLCALRNAIQFTSIADHPIYKNKKNVVMAWLLEGVEIFRSDIERFLPMFSLIKNIFTETNSKHNYIMLNICGDRKKDDREDNDRTPSTDGLAELKFSANFAKAQKQRIFGNSSC